MASLTFLKDAAIYRIDVDPLTGTFVIGEFFVDTVDPTKLGEVIAFTDDMDGTGTLDYILVGGGATQFASTDTFTGDGSGTGTVNGAPAEVGTQDVHVIQVDDPFTVVTIQDLVNQVREYEDELINLDHPKIIDASGKQDLGGGVLVGITLELLDNWRIQFEPRNGPLIISVSITGGNIVATNDYEDIAIKPSPFTQVTITSSSSATIAQLEIIDLIHRIESLRKRHSAFGNVIYWNPTTGDDGFTGDSPDTGTKTFARAHDIAVAGNGDVIFALNKGAAGNIRVNEQLNFTKNGVSLRGPGASFHIHNLVGTGPSITITASNVAIEHITIEHDAVAVNLTDGILIDGSVTAAGHALIKNVTFIGINQHAISINDSPKSELKTIFIEETTGDGIRVGDNVDYLFIADSIISSADNGVNLFGTNINNTILVNNNIHENTKHGCRIGPAANETIVRKSNWVFANGIGEFLEVAGSTGTHIESLTDNQRLFDGKVTVDQSDGSAGLEFPVGTPEHPSNNLTDALLIAGINNLEDLFLREGTFIVSTALNFNKTILTGSGPARARVIFVAGAYTTNLTVFDRLFVAGQMNGDSMLMRNCAVGSGDLASLAVTEYQGSFNGCAIVGDIVARANTGGENSIAFINCYTAGNQIPTIDLNGDKALTIQNYSGQLKIDGITGTDGNQLLRIGMLHGDIELLSGNTGTSSIVLEGLGNYVNNGSLVVNDNNLITKIIQDNNDDPSIFV